VIVPFLTADASHVKDAPVGAEPAETNETVLTSTADISLCAVNQELFAAREEWRYRLSALHEYDCINVLAPEIVV